MRWDDLGDDELHARLVQHGLDRTSAGALVVDRDEPSAAALIAETLDG